MGVNTARLTTRVHELAEIGRIGETGVRRLAHSKKDQEGMALVESWMKEAGLATRIDEVGNLIGRLEGRDSSLPIFMLGSHIDSQPYGGRFDGAIGVLGALESVQTLVEEGYTFEGSIEVIAFSDEEGSRFNKGIFGSRGLIGELEEGELEREDEDGITRRQALEEMGLDPERVHLAAYDPEQLFAFLEMHIEQGPVLEDKGAAAGIVTGISGPLWLTVTYKGFAGHAGSVPMHLRRDALLGASEATTALNTIVGKRQPAPTIGTVGNIKVFPNSRNIIPEEVKFTVDLRDIDLERRNECESELRVELEAIAARHGLELDIQEDTNSDPRYCAEWIQSIMAEQAGRLKMEAPKLMSGPFHDAMPISKVCDYGMIFVRCKDGISHNPLEYSTDEDIIEGTKLYYETVKQIAGNMKEYQLKHAADKINS